MDALVVFFSRLSFIILSCLDYLFCFNARVSRVSYDFLQISQ